MKRPALKSRLLRYLQDRPGVWIAKGALCDLARLHTGATGEHTGRRLRELENEAKVLVEYRKNHAYYSIAEAARPKRQLVTELPNGSVRIEYV